MLAQRSKGSACVDLLVAAGDDRLGVPRAVRFGLYSRIGALLEIARHDFAASISAERTLSCAPTAEVEMAHFGCPGSG